MRKSVPALTAAALALTACQTMKSETVNYTTANVQNRFILSNKTITSFPITLSGRLWLPEGNGPFPVVVWGHPSTMGSNNLAQWRRNLRSELISEGIGIFFSDSYTGRGLPRSNTWIKLNSSSRYVDGIRALDALAKHQKVDPKRIGISGASFGANVAMRLQWETHMNQIQPGGPRYAAHVAIYPPCNTIIKDYKSTGAPMLILIGEKDWNYASRCEDRAKELQKSGAQVKVIIYPGAYHCFLASTPPKIVNSPVYGDCGVRIFDKETGLSTRINARDTWPNCIKPQGMCGGNRTASDDALRRTVAFFVKHLRK